MSDDLPVEVAEELAEEMDDEEELVDAGMVAVVEAREAEEPATDLPWEEAVAELDLVPPPADPSAPGDSITSELEHRMRLMRMIERMTASVLESLEGDNPLKPKNFRDLTMALGSAGRIMEMQMKAIEGLRESEQRIEQRLIDAVVGLSDYLQLTREQCERLAQVRLSGTIPRAGEVPVRMAAPMREAQQGHIGGRPRVLRTPTGERLGYAPEPPPKPQGDPDALLRRETGFEMPPGAERVPEVQRLRQALDLYEVIPEPRESLVIRAPGPEQAMRADPPKKKRQISDAERQRRRELGLKMMPIMQAKRKENIARRKAEKEAALAVESESAE